MRIINYENGERKDVAQHHHRDEVLTLWALGIEAVVLYILLAAIF